MAELLPVPEVAAGATEVVISDWLVAAGDEFRAGDPIAVIETEKAIVEVEGESDATLLRVLVPAGSRVAVGSPMALLGTPEELSGDLDAVLAGLGVGGAGGEEPPAPAPARREVPDRPPEHDDDRGDRIFASPLARKLLKEAGLPLDGIVGTGPRGRIRRRDVEAAVAAAAEATVGARSNEAAQPPAYSAVPAEQVPAEQGASVGTAVPHTRLRRAVARRLTQSKQEIPHFYVKRTAVLDDLLALRGRLNATSPVRISVNDLLVRAIAVAHTQVPDANVIWTEEALQHFEHVDVAVAIASGRGLVTPVLRGVETRSLSAISRQVAAYAELADEGRLQQQDLEGGSITISNLGMYGVEEFSAIINPPQSAILAVGAARPAPRVVEGEVVVATVVELVLSVDHRAIDGALAAQWMAALVESLESPLRLVV